MLKAIRSAAKKTKIIAFSETPPMAFAPFLCEFRAVTAYCFKSLYHRFQFYATIGGLSSEENHVSAAVNHRYHIWKCMGRAGSASNGFQWV